MVYKLLLNGMIPILILEANNPLGIKAEHKNNLINKFCIASIKSKLKFEDKKKSETVSHFTCKCFSEKFQSGSSIKNSRIYCKKKAIEKFNL
tara:strand:+ start:69 stop:344 length:276 start_codon:yes stop_codon:yes gene_type:complete